MSTVVDQANDDEPTILDQVTIDKFYANYHAVFDSLPDADSEPTIEQLTAIVALLNAGAPPYADFAVWGPHGYRTMKRLKLGGLTIQPGGELRQTE